MGATKMLLNSTTSQMVAAIAMLRAEYLSNSGANCGATKIWAQALETKIAEINAGPPSFAAKCSEMATEVIVPHSDSKK